METPTLSTISEYAEGVVSGEIQACEWIRYACQRHLDDCKREDIYWDEDSARRPISFIERLPHVKGKWAAKRETITLELWQKFAVASIFGWRRTRDDLRRYREAYMEIPRKNGKSVLAAGVGLYCMLADGEYGAEVYSGATTEKQAWEVFRPARLMAQKTPPLKQKYDFEINASNLLRLEDFSRFEPLIGNPGDGASPSCAIVDEFHEHDKPDLYDTMVTGMGAREQPLMFVITTAGANIGGPCYEKRDYCQKVLNKTFDDDAVFSLIYTLDEGDDWKDEANWYKANPNLGVSVSKEFLSAQIGTAIRQPSKQNPVKTKHFNIWVGARSAWINMEHWNAAADSSLKEEDFASDDAYLGLDLATRIDVAALLRVYRRVIDGQLHYYAFPSLYIPESALDGAKNSSSYAGWAGEGYLDVMDGDEITFSLVQEQIEELATRVRIAEMAYDPWQSTQMAQNLDEKGLPVVEYRNTVGNMNPPMRELEGALASGRFHHPDNKVLNWMASNVTAKEDAKDNIYPRKELPENKIDGIVALLMAMGRAMYKEQEDCIYNKRGIRTL